MSSPDKDIVRARAVSFAELIRPNVALLPVIIYVSVIVVNDGFSFQTFVLGALLSICAYGVVVIQNNVVDREIDIANKRKDNPVAVGKLDEADARRALFVTFVIGLISALLIGPLALLWLYVYIFFGWLYSGKISLKDKSYPAIIILGVCYGVMPWLLGGLVSGATLDAKYLLVMAASFLYVVGIISLKDFKDVTGDRQYGKMTILVVKGMAYTRYLMQILTAVGYLTLIIFCVSQTHWQLAGIGLIGAIVNMAVLGRAAILSSPRFRARYGTLVRGMFYCYAILVYAIV